jgi:hypothetical protein
MNHLNRNCNGIQLDRIQIQGFAGCIYQQRSDSLSTTEDRVPECLMQFRRLGLGIRQPPIQRRIDTQSVL